MWKVTLLAIQLLVVSNVNGAPRRRYDDEIAPDKAEVIGGKDGKNILDGDKDTKVEAEKSGAEKAWIELSFDNAQCVSEIVWHDSAGTVFTTWNCGPEGCKEADCKGGLCPYFATTVSVASGSSDNLFENSNCKNGDKVRLERKDTSNFMAYDIAIKGSAATCQGGYYYEHSCTMCPKNTYKPAGDTGNYGNCYPCPGTKESPAGSKAESDCVDGKGGDGNKDFSGGFALSISTALATGILAAILL